MTPFHANTEPPRGALLAFTPTNYEREKTMLSSGWLLWMIVIFVFIVPPIGYGWGYRGWGPPLPRYVQRRRGHNAQFGGKADFDHEAWGWGGDFLWILAIAGVLWFFTSLWRH